MAGGEEMIGGMLGKLLQFSPQILDAAQQIYSGYSKRREDDGEAPVDLVRRVRALEAAGAEQSQLVAQVARQLSDVTCMLVSLEKKARRACAVATVASVISLISLGVAIFR
ncbi:MAG TPA: hypothetical protein VNX25_10545 [Verrucomicrobiae bacterium]|nr:hypothetical protein [Verrucomicrobiae bacterium]